MGSDVSSRRLSVVFLISLIILAMSGVAFAAIVSGVATTNSSSHERITQLVLNRPQVSNGDLMLASIAIKGGTLADVTVPAGWTQITRTDNDTDVTLISYWKIANGSEPSTYTWTVAGQTQAEGGITPYSGVDASNPIDVFTSNTGSGSLATIPAITTSASNDKVVDVFAVDIGRNNNAGSYFSTPKGTVEKYDVSNVPFGPSIATFDSNQVVTGSTGGVSSKISVGKARNWAGQQIALHMSTPTLTNGLVSYWKLDGNSNDAIGTNNGSDTNITYLTSNGKIKQGAGFDGSASAITTGLSDIGSYSAGTVSAWVKFNSVSSGGAIIGDWDVSPDHILYLFNSGSDLICARGTDNDPAQSTYPISNLSNGMWYNIVCTFTISGGSTSTQLYVNGIKVGTNVNSTDSVETDPKLLVIGADFYNNSWGNRINGAIDEVGIWNRVLAPSEISMLYSGGIGLQYPF